MATLSNTIPAPALVNVTSGGTGVTTITGLVKGNGTAAFTAASAGTDYVSPSGTETLTNKTLTTANLWNSTAVTAANGTSNTMIATTQFVLNNIPAQQQSSGISTGKSIAMAMIFGF